MANTKLGQLLEYIQNSPGMTSLQDIASDLNLSVSQAENMLEFWVRKGRIQISNDLSECGRCGVKGDCSKIFEMPRVYELIGPQKSKSQENQDFSCPH